MGNSNKQESKTDKWTEDLLWQAERAAYIGREHCTCVGRYHVLWSSLRASGFLGSLHTEEDALRETLSPFCEQAARILIGGSADPATLCLLGRLFDSRNLDITIIDRCQAPLELIKEFAERKHVSCSTIKADLLNFHNAKKWDLIFLNYTLSFVAPENRGRFFKSLKDSLSQSGRLICLSKTGTRAEAGRKNQLANAWFERARYALRDSGLDRHFDGLALEAAIKSYANERTKRRYNIISETEIEELFRAEGFDVSSVRTTRREWKLEGMNDEEADTESSVIVVGTKRV